MFSLFIFNVQTNQKNKLHYVNPLIYQKQIYRTHLYCYKKFINIRIDGSRFAQGFHYQLILKNQHYINTTSRQAFKESHKFNNPPLDQLVAVLICLCCSCLGMEQKKQWKPGGFLPEQRSRSIEIYDHTVCPKRINLFYLAWLPVNGSFSSLTIHWSKLQLKLKVNSSYNFIIL